MSDPLWITEADVVGLMDLGEAIGALESALRAEAKGDAQNMSKTLMQYGKSNLHAIGARLDGLVGTKTWAHTEGGTCPLLLLWDAQNGALVAVIEAFALGNMRTGGISGVAANMTGFSQGLTDATARSAAVWVFVSVIPLALAGAWATWRMTGSAEKA